MFIHYNYAELKGKGTTPYPKYEQFQKLVQ